MGILSRFRLVRLQPVDRERQHWFCVNQKGWGKADQTFAARPACDVSGDDLLDIIVGQSLYHRLRGVELLDKLPRLSRV